MAGCPGCGGDGLDFPDALSLSHSPMSVSPFPVVSIVPTGGRRGDYTVYDVTRSGASMGWKSEFRRAEFITAYSPDSRPDSITSVRESFMGSSSPVVSVSGGSYVAEVVRSNDKIPFLSSVISGGGRDRLTMNSSGVTIKAQDKNKPGPSGCTGVCPGDSTSITLVAHVDGKALAAALSKVTKGKDGKIHPKDRDEVSKTEVVAALQQLAAKMRAKACEMCKAALGDSCCDKPQAPCDRKKGCKCPSIGDCDDSKAELPHKGAADSMEYKKEDIIVYDGDGDDASRQNYAGRDGTIWKDTKDFGYVQERGKEGAREKPIQLRKGSPTVGFTTLDKDPKDPVNYMDYIGDFIDTTGMNSLIVVRQRCVSQKTDCS
jgi:hypothetical protein